LPGLGLLVVVFLTTKSSFSFGKCKGPSQTKSEMSKPQDDGNANSLLYSRGRSSNKRVSCAAIQEHSAIHHLFLKKHDNL